MEYYDGTADEFRGVIDWKWEEARVTADAEQSKKLHIDIPITFVEIKD